MLVIKTEDPGVHGVRRAVKAYIKRNPGFEAAITLYGAVMEAQQEALEKIDCSIEMDNAEIEGKLQDGKPLLAGKPVEIDPEDLQKLVSVISREVDAGGREGNACSDKLLSWDGLEAGNIDKTRLSVISGEPIDISNGLSEREAELASNILWEAFSPFYRKYGSILEIKMDQSIWQRGFCPVCGGSPLMGKFRSGDGLWLLECSLCHTLWNVQRARCPFCREGKEGSLKYLYLDGNKTYRAQYCDSCKVYVKTIDLRESERTSLLPVEDIITMELDQAARDEGLKSAFDFFTFES